MTWYCCGTLNPAIVSPVPRQNSIWRNQDASFEFGSVRHGFPTEERGASETSVNHEDTAKGAAKDRRPHLSPPFIFDSEAICSQRTSGKVSDLMPSKSRENNSRNKANAAVGNFARGSLGQARSDSVGFMRGLKPPLPSRLCFTAGCGVMATHESGDPPWPLEVCAIEHPCCR
jgi:hypothetical protein